MTINRRSKSLYVQITTYITLIILSSILVYFYTSLEAKIKAETIILSKKSRVEDIKEKNILTRQQINNINKKIKALQDNFIDIEVIKKQLSTFLNSIEFANIKLTLIEYDKKYNNLLNVELEVKSNNDSIGDNLTAMFVKKVLSIKPILLVMKPLKDEYTLENNRLKFTYFKSNSSSL